MCRNIIVAHYDILSGGFHLPVSEGPDGLLREVNNTVHATMVILGGQSDDVKATRTKGACVHCSVAMGRGDEPRVHACIALSQWGGEMMGPLTTFQLPCKLPLLPWTLSPERRLLLFWLLFVKIFGS
jgi:hypothetical protein